MDSIGTVLPAAAAAPVAKGERERAPGTSVPIFTRGRVVDGQSPETSLSRGAAVLRVVRGAVEQLRTASGHDYDVEEAVTTAVVDTGHEYAPGTELAHNVDLYA